MKEYKKVTKSYETQKVKKCICDRCGKECQIKEDDFLSKRTLIDIHPMYADDEHLYRDLCVDCTKELLEWFKNGKNNKEIEDFAETLDIWERD